MNIIFGNYGDNTLALIQWAYEEKLESVFVVHVETGWAAEHWTLRVEKAQQLVRRYRFQPVTLIPKADFSELVLDRGRFPSRKFQWCAAFLKGLPFLEWLDEVDPARAALLLLGSRRADSRARAQLPAQLAESEHFGERKVHYPLVDCSNAERDAFIERAGFVPLRGRSRECEPCIHAPVAELRAMDAVSGERLAALEKRVGQTMFASLQAVDVEICRSSGLTEGGRDSAGLECFDMGCGAPYACGE